LRGQSQACILNKIHNILPIPPPFILNFREIGRAFGLIQLLEKAELFDRFTPPLEISMIGTDSLDGKVYICAENWDRSEKTNNAI
jgi:hypothetical protein